ncbi:unnamed protein product [Amoebophrya sp. A25]|nr:unnamed protein product [Amoebophrya sp. A25]|eukprot:GSA25T00021381001.1
MNTQDDASTTARFFRVVNINYAHEHNRYPDEIRTRLEADSLWENVDRASSWTPAEDGYVYRDRRRRSAGGGDYRSSAADAFSDRSSASGGDYRSESGDLPRWEWEWCRGVECTFGEVRPFRPSRELLGAPIGRYNGSFWVKALIKQKQCALRVMEYAKLHAAATPYQYVIFSRPDLFLLSPIVLTSGLLQDDAWHFGSHALYARHYDDNFAVIPLRLVWAFAQQLNFVLDTDLFGARIRVAMDSVVTFLAQYFNIPVVVHGWGYIVVRPWGDPLRSPFNADPRMLGMLRLLLGPAGPDAKPGAVANATRPLPGFQFGQTSGD